LLGWRGEVLLRGADAPLGGLLPLENGAFKRGEAPHYSFNPLKKNYVRVWKINQFERGSKEMSTDNER
jgi:hypothetical protein